MKSSLRAFALLRHREGITRMRPLAGGIEAWRQREYPTEPHPEITAATADGELQAIA